ncbi:hypothetical protein [Streptosporangium amethystogenes]|uniref:hypothetical protein n=1 Tax=Streptosporangium amethystogenes TaxID=2002 RepID=UPI0004C80BB7|nr:hypothetical protein [Streptosporangium amethystogenes]
MRPVAKIATGFVLVFGAFRFNGFDLLLDPVGWNLCVSGLFRLERSVDDPFGRARLAAVAMVCTSLVATIVSIADSSRTLSTSSLGEVIGIANTAGTLITVWLITDAIIRRIRPQGAISPVALLDVLRWLVVGLGVLGALVQHGYADLGLFALVAWFAAIVALIIVLYRSAHLPYLS